jgi:hypothetical protein
MAADRSANFVIKAKDEASKVIDDFAGGIGKSMFTASHRVHASGP